MRSVQGPTFWDQGILTTLGLQESDLVQRFGLRDLPLNESFLMFGALGCFFNIAAACVSSFYAVCRFTENGKQPSYKHVIKKRLSEKKDIISPLFGLWPFIIQAGCNVYWLQQASGIMASGHLVAFCLYWGVAFAYQVGLLITAFTTKQRFPYFNILMVVAAVGAADAREAAAGGTAFQTSIERQITAVYIALGFSLVVYGIFVRDVIGSVSLVA